MQLLPLHAIGIINLWIFPFIYGIISIIIISCISKDAKKKLLTFPKKNENKKENILMITSFLFGKGLIIYSIFIPININSKFFLIGVCIYLIGLILSSVAILTFANADLSKPITKGIYKFSRHPMQVMNYVMWIGIGIISQTWIIIFCTIIFTVVSLPSIKRQEKYCANRYGNEYIKYMNETPRYIFF